MPYAYDSGLIERIMPRVRQWENTTGRRIQPSMLDALIEDQLDMESKRASSERAYDIQQQNADTAAQQAADAKKANKVSGITGAAGTAVNAGLVYKYLSKPTTPSATPTTTPAVTPQATPGAQSAMSGTDTGYTGAQVPQAKPYQTPSDAYGADLTSAEYAPNDVGAYYDTATPASTGYNPTGSTLGNMGVGLAAGLATNYAVTKTGEGKKSNSAVADISRNWLGMTKWNDDEYASKGSATVGGLAASGPWGAAAANIVWDVGKAFEHGKISNELIGIPYADRVFNTDLGSIFGW